MSLVSNPVSPEQPSAAHFRDALQKGLGRALRWAEMGQSIDKSILLEACLTDQRYDRQCEDSRGAWLWRIMTAVGAIDKFREPIFLSLQRIEDGLAAQQLCEFAAYYARAGDNRFRLQLRNVVAQKPVADCPWLGEGDLIALEGETGFLFGAQARGESLADRDWEWDDENLVDMAADVLGQPAVDWLLKRDAKSSTAIDRFWTKRAAAQFERAQTPRECHAARIRQYPMTSIISDIEAGRKMGGMLRGWGMHADASDLSVVLDRLLLCQDPEKLVAYLRIFSNRSFPKFDARALALLNHADPLVRRWAYTALGKNRHPAIRDMAIDRLHERINEDSFLELFVANLEPGDERLVADSLVHFDTREDSHGILMDVLSILEKNHACECLVLGTFVYYSTPCSSCRHGAAKVLVDRKVAPDWLIDECRFDAEPDTRKLVDLPDLTPPCGAPAGP